MKPETLDQVEENNKEIKTGVTNAKKKKEKKRKQGRKRCELGNKNVGEKTGKTRTDEDTKSNEESTG